MMPYRRCPHGKTMNEHCVICAKMFDSEDRSRAQLIQLVEDTARMIAAAPKMLNTLKFVQTQCRYDGKQCPEVDAAITEAEGES